MANKGRYISNNHTDNPDELLELWWVQGPLSKIKKIFIKTSTGRILYNKDGKKLATALPWYSDKFYDFDSAEKFHIRFKSSSAVNLLTETEVKLNESERYIKNYSDKYASDVQDIRDLIIKLRKKILNGKTD